MIPKIAYCALLMCTQWIHAADFSDLQLYNAGRGGNNTRQGLARFDQDVLEVHPDTVIIFFGMNDAINSGASIPLDAFEQNLTEMVTRSKANGITPYLVTVHSVIEEPLYQRHSQKLESFYLARGGANAIIESYNPVIRKVAQETDTRLIDFSKAAKDHLRNSPDVPLVVPDGVHLSPSGKKLLADTIAPYLIDQSPKPEKVVCFGDSLTRLGYDTELYSLLDPERFPKYTTSVPSAKAHPDLDPPIRLFDKKSKGVSLNSVEYRGDVEVLVDLEQTSFVNAIAVVYFSGGNYKLSEIELSAGMSPDNLSPVAIRSIPSLEGQEREAHTATFVVNSELRFFKVTCRRAEDADRILISEIIVE